MATGTSAQSSTEDPRLKHIMRAIELNDHRSDALIEILHKVQAIYGHLSLEMLALVSRELNVPPSRVYGVATFYHFFSLRPKGEHTCIVCTGTACYVKGSQAIVQHLEDRLGIKVGQTTKDNQLSLEVARCVGACGLAPVVILDNEILAKLSPQAVEKKVQGKIHLPA